MPRLRPVVVLVAGLGFILLHAFLESEAGQLLIGHAHLNQHFVMTFVLDMGLSCIIAFIILVCIDQPSRGEFKALMRGRIDTFQRTVDLKITEVEEAVFKAILGRNIPREILEEVEMVILRAKFYRTDHRSTYRFTLTKARDLNPSTPNIQLMTADVTTEYAIQNITGVEQEYIVRVELGAPVIDGLDEHVNVERILIDGIRVNESEMVTTMTGKEKVVEHKITIPTGGKRKIVIRHHKVKQTEDTEIWRSLLPSDGMKLVVYLPRGSKGFGAHAAHRVKLTDEGQFEEAAGVRHEWVLHAPMLPYQGIAFWWIFDGNGSGLWNGNGERRNRRAMTAVSGPQN
jgi:hypothetical protein